MRAQLTPDGIKFNGYEKTQKKPICTVAGIEPDNDGNISLNLSSINDQISDLDGELLILEQTPSRTLVLSQSATSVNEGDSVTITLTTTNVFNGGRIPYTITASGIDLNNDFTSPVATTGNFEIQNNSDSLTLTIKADDLTESSPESFTLTLNVGNNPSVTVNVSDTSQEPVNTEWIISSDKTTVAEGEPFKISILPGPTFSAPETTTTIIMGSTGSTVTTNDIFYFTNNLTIPTTQTVFGLGVRVFFQVQTELSCYLELILTEHLKV